MTPTEKEMLIRQYAAGEITWHELRERGFEDYVQVLGALGELGLRQPIAPMEGPNVAVRRCVANDEQSFRLCARLVRDGAVADLDMIWGGRRVGSIWRARTQRRIRAFHNCCR
jgi:hypothetical protein